MLEMIGTYGGFAAQLAMMWLVSDYYRDPWDWRKGVRLRNRP